MTRFLQRQMRIACLPVALVLSARVAAAATIAVCVCLLPATVSAQATVAAADCSQAAVQAAITGAVDGDTVVIPAGTCTWTTNLQITGKFLTVQGAGMDLTVIVDGVSKEPYPNVPHVLDVDTKPGGLTRITGLTFQGGTIVDPYNKGMVLIRGNSDQFRLDHIRIRTTDTTSGVTFAGNVRGLVDHSVFTINNWRMAIYTHHDRWNDTGFYGDASYADDSHFGTDKAIVIEDNLFESTVGAFAHDGWSGSRVVFRYNTLRNMAFANHGTESSGRWRGQRLFEVYRNSFLNDVWQYPNIIGIRGGTGVVFDNIVRTSGSGFISTIFGMVNYRYSDRSREYVFGFCTGANPWDGNQSGGYPCLDQPGRGKGDLLDGDAPTPRWLNQVSDPVYVWNNTLNGLAEPLRIETIDRDVIVEGRDFFNAPKPGYVPLVYPHPLVSGAAPEPEPEPEPEPPPADTVAPTVTATVRQHGGSHNYTVTITALDNVAVVQIALMQGTGVRAACSPTPPAAKATCVVQLALKPRGTYTYEAQAWDSSNNMASTPVTIRR